MIFKKFYEMNDITLEFTNPAIESKFLDNYLKVIINRHYTKKGLIIIGIFCFSLLFFEIFIASINHELNEYAGKIYKYFIVFIIGILSEYFVNKSKRFCKYRTLPAFVIIITLVNYISFTRNFIGFNIALYNMR